jgi:hypothetical protein
MQQTTGVAVLATQLAQTDRRALSQAWYSALHLAGRSVGVPPPDGTAVTQRSAHRGPSLARSAPNPAEHARCGGQRLSRAAAPRATSAEAPERRLARSELARRIERGLARRTPRSGAASFAIRAGGGRVHLVVRADGARTRVVAVCAPPLRERVERALAQARFALAGRGVRTEVA